MQLDVEGFCGRHCNDEASLCLKQVKLHLRLILKFRLDFVGGWGGEPVCRHVRDMPPPIYLRMGTYLTVANLWVPLVLQLNEKKLRILTGNAKRETLMWTCWDTPAVISHEKH